MTESEIRKALVLHLAASPQGRGAAFIAELFVDGFARRADLVMANGKLAAFEIKSPRDTLHRLEGQLQSYARFFEQVTIVCAQRHVDGVVNSASEHVGVWSVTDSGDLSVVRHATTKSLPVKSNWLSFLPVHELRALLRAHACKTVGGRPELVERAASMRLRTIRQYVLDYLKRRHERIDAIVTRRAAARASRAQASRHTNEQLIALLQAAPIAAVAIPRVRPKLGNHSTSGSSYSPPRRSDRSI